MPNPYSRFYDPDRKPEPPANPYAALYRQGAGQPQAPSQSRAYGPWEDTASPLVQRRRKPDGTYETRPKPGAIPGGAPGVGQEPDPYAGRHPHAVVGEQVLSRVKEGVAGALDLPEMSGAIADKLPPWARLLPPVQALRLQRELKRGADTALGGLPSALRESVGDEYVRRKDDLSQSLISRGASPLAAASSDTALEGVAAVLDPTNALPGGAAVDAARTGRRVGRFAGVLDDIPPASIVSPEDAAEAAYLAARERNPGVLPGDERFVQPGSVREALKPEAEILEVGARRSREAQETALGLRAPDDAADLARASLEIADRSELPGPPLPPRPFDELADEAMAGLERPENRRSPVEPMLITAQGELGAPASVPWAPRMSTKALESVAGMEDEFRELVAKNRSAIYRGRGDVVPASTWHNAQQLADDLGMSREDFLQNPAFRGDREVALGRAYMGGMKQEMNELAGAISRGEVSDLNAAKARLADLEVDTVRMMSNIQARLAEGGRVLREGQEALAPWKGDPRRELQAALLKRYGAQNAEAAAAIEAKAVARLQRRAAAETRKAQRAATAEELAAEFSSLAESFGKISRAARPRAVLDPEMVGLMGRMAQNRVKAGVNAVEQIADEIFQVARAHIEGLTVEDVRAAVVDSAMSRKPRTTPLLDPEARRLAVAEARAGGRVAKLEQRVQAGPSLPASRSPADSPRLQELRGRADALRKQILSDPREGLVARYRELLDDATVEKIAMLPADPASPDLLAFLRQMEKPTFRDYRTSYWINSVLSGTKTMIRNGVGNAVRLAELTAMRPAGAVVEQGLARLQGRAPERLLREMIPATVGVFKGIPDGVKKFAFVMKNGYDPQRLVAELTGEAVAKFDAESSRLPLSPFLLSDSPAVRGVGTVVTMPSRILEATDAMVKTIAQTSELNAAAVRRAAQEGLSGDALAHRAADLIADPTPEMLAEARAFAKKATYQDPMSWVGNLASAIRRGPNVDAKARELRAAGGLSNRALATGIESWQTVSQHLLPFIHISDRVAASITDYIPLSKPRRLAELVAEQSPEAADLIARQVVGGALGMAGVALANQGLLVGAAPRDEKLRNDFYADGKQPYSLLMGGRWVPMRDALGPLAGPFVAAAVYHDHLQVGEDPSQAVSGMTLSTASYMLDASYMSTLQDVLQAVNEERGGAGAKLQSAAARVAGGYVPYSGLLRNVATALDPRVVEKEDFSDEISAGLPGLREDLPSRYDALGQPLEMATGPAGGFSPIVPTESQLADPDLAEDVGRLRYTVERRRTEINRTVAQIKDAQKGKDVARVKALRASLPAATVLKAPQVALDRVRALEGRLRLVRANDKLTADQKRSQELRLQQQMAAILQAALKRTK